MFPVLIILSTVFIILKPDNTPKIYLDENGEYVYDFEYDNRVEFEYKLLKEIYLWPNEIVEFSKEEMAILSENDTDFDPFYDFLSKNDEWSYKTDIVTSDMINNENLRLDIGFDYIWNQYNYVITDIDTDGPLYREGIRKGDILISIDSKLIDEIPDSQLSDILWYDFSDSHEFVFDTKSKGLLTVNHTGYEYKVNSVEKVKIIRQEGKNIGYLAFSEFLNSSFDELFEAFNKFEKKNIDEIIIDLRLNGGGLLDVADYMIDILLGNSFDGKVSYSLKHNKKYRHFDYKHKIEDAGFDFDFQRIIFLTSNNTYSASEVLICSLDAYIDTVLIGSNTGGKPVGMWELDTEDFVYSPISFELKNSKGVGGWYNGLSADHIMGNTYRHEYGDINDPLINKALSIISEG